MHNVGLGGGSVQLIVGLDSVRASLAHHEDDGRTRASAPWDPMLAGHLRELDDGPTVAFGARLTG
jgi:hypothetical protein